MGHRASALDETDLVSLFSNSEWIIEMKSVKLDDRPEGFNLASEDDPTSPNRHEGGWMR